MIRGIVVTGLAGLLVGTVAATAIVMVNPARFYPGFAFDGRALVIGAGMAAMALGAMLLAQRSREAASVAILFAVALRLCAYALFGQEPGETDNLAFANIADNIRSGNGILCTDPCANFRAVYPPLYPLALAAFGNAFLLSLVVDALIAAAIWRLAHIVDAPRTPAVAAYLILTAAYSPLPHKEGLATLMTLVVVLGLLEKRPGAVGLGAAGVALAQPAWLAFVVACGLMLGVRSVFPVALRAVPYFLAAMLPWWIRNYMMFGEFVPLTIAFGSNLLFVATNSFDVIRSYIPLGELAMGKASLARAIEVIAADPLTYLRLRVVGTVQAWALNGMPGQLLNSPALIYASQLTWCGFVALALRGALGNETVLRLLAAVGVAVLIGMWMEFGERHRYFALPFMAIVMSLPLSRPQSRSPEPRSTSRQ